MATYSDKIPRRSKPLCVRFTADEFERLKHDADEHRPPLTVSDLVRERCLVEVQHAKASYLDKPAE